MRQRQSPGYTLKELFVLYVLLVLLALIFWPALQGAKPKWRSACCQQNLKQLGQAILMYAEDFDGTLPPAVTPLGVGWPRLVGPYVREADLRRLEDMRQRGFRQRDPWPGQENEAFRCPEDVGRFRLARPLYLDHPNGLSYIANGEILRSPGAPGLRHEAIHNASSVILLAERNRAVLVSWRFTKANFPGAVAGQRHQRGANYAFVDGHTRWMRREFFKDGRATIEPDLSGGATRRGDGSARR